MYRQVTLKKIEDKKYGTYKTCWIPDNFARERKIIEIDGELWEVTWASSNVIAGPLYPEALIREHRKNTGDSLGRVR